MTQVLKAVYDGKVFKPEEPVKIPAHTSVELTVHTSEIQKKGKPYSFFRHTASLKLKGPKDFSENLDDYLYRDKPMK
jgi:predicted DNA-binding antitoxin AbrB/MazE fold protein